MGAVRRGWKSVTLRSLYLLGEAPPFKRYLRSSLHFSLLFLLLLGSLNVDILVPFEEIVVDGCDLLDVAVEVVFESGVFHLDIVEHVQPD